MVGPEVQGGDDEVDFPPERPFGEPLDPAEREPLEDDEPRVRPDEARLAGCGQARAPVSRS